MLELKDVQKERDSREIPLDRVGIDNVRFPIRISCKGGGYQEVQSTVSMFASLFKDIRGTNMSRFLERLASYQWCPISSEMLPGFLKEMQEHLEAEDVYVSFKFVYFVERSSPVTDIVVPQGYDVAFTAWMVKQEFTFVLECNTPVSLVCPCSLEISEVGAHNQRGNIRARVTTNGATIWIEDLVSILESCGSAPVHTVLKRPDEKFVTEQMFRNPKFVEDTARDVYLQLDGDPKITKFDVKVESFESIHPHNAVVYVKKIGVGL